MKGIILAGGEGTRMHPLTLTTTKQLLPIAGLQMIFYPLNSLLMAGIRQIHIIVKPNDLELFQRIIGDGSHFDADISYAVQHEAIGLPQAYLIGAEFIGTDSVALILGDNYFTTVFREYVNEFQYGSVIFGIQMNNPSAYGVVEFDEKSGAVFSLEEKPKNPRSPYAIPGIYLTDCSVVDKARHCLMSPRGELEIVDIHKMFLRDGQLICKPLRGCVWLDTGTLEDYTKTNLVAGVMQDRLFDRALWELFKTKGWK